MRKIITTFTLLFTLATITFAQVNTELLRKRSDESKWINTIDLSLGYKSGNSNYSNIKAGCRSDYFAEDFYSFLSASIEYKEGNNSLITHKGFAHLRCVFRNDGLVNPEIFLQKEFNRFISLKDRMLAGGGARISLFENDDDSSKYHYRLTAGIGLMYEREKFSKEGITATKLLRSTNYVNFTWNLDDRIGLIFITYFQVDAERLSDHRILNDTKLLFSITDYLKFTVNLNYRYDNEPLPGLEKYDIGITNGIAIKF